MTGTTAIHRGRPAADPEVVRQRLATVGSEVRQEFLAVGARLQTIALRCREIAQAAEEGGGYWKGNNGGESLRQLREGMDRLGESSGAVIGGGRERLGEVLRLLGQVAADLSLLRKISKDLRLLGVSTRIYSTGVASGGRSFRSLGDAIKTLTAAVEERLVLLLERIELLGGNLRTVRDGMDTRERGQAEQAGEIIRRIREVSGVAEGLQSLAAAVTAEMRGSADDILRRIGDMVVALQFEDIFRQRIDKAARALGALPTGAVSGEPAPAGVATVAADACRFLAADLRRSGNELRGVTRRLMAHLQGLSDGVAGMVSGVGRAHQRGDAFLPALEEGMRAIRSDIDRRVAADLAVSGFTDGVTVAAAGMADQVAGIEEIGAEIELIALNARVKAARAGSGGAGMEVATEAIQSVADEVCRLTSSLAEGLRLIDQTASGLRQGMEDAARTQEEKIRMLSAGVEEVTVAFRQFQGHAVNLLADVDRRAQDLQREIGGVLAMMTVQDSGERTLHEVSLEVEWMAYRFEVGGRDRGAPIGVGPEGYRPGESAMPPEAADVDQEIGTVELF